MAIGTQSNIQFMFEVASNLSKHVQMGLNTYEYIGEVTSEGWIKIMF